MLNDAMILIYQSSDNCKAMTPALTRSGGKALIEDLRNIFLWYSLARVADYYLYLA